jgi:hypothetical protein
VLNRGSSGREGSASDCLSNFDLWRDRPKFLLSHDFQNPYQFREVQSSGEIRAEREHLGDRIPTD